MEVVDFRGLGPVLTPIVHADEFVRGGAAASWIRASMRPDGLLLRRRGQRLIAPPAVGARCSGTGSCRAPAGGWSAVCPSWKPGCGYSTRAQAPAVLLDVLGSGVLDVTEAESQYADAGKKNPW